jgi:subtilisin family serine protease
MTKLHGILSLLVVFLLPAALLGVQAAEQIGEPDFYHYVRSIGPIPLKLNTEKIGIRFQPGVTEEDQANVLLSDDALDPLAELTPLGHNGTLLVGLKPGATRASILDTIQRLSAADAVYYASPVVQSRIGYDELVNNKFYVSLPESVKPADVDRLNAEQHVETVSIRGFPKRATNGWWFRITKGSTLNAIGMSNLYYERLGALGASPGLICLYDVLAGWDTYYRPDGQGGLVDCATNQYDNQCNLCAIHVPDAWNVTTGDPHIVVAVLDTGVDMDYGTGGGNPDLNPNQWINPSPDGANGEHPYDYYGWNFVEGNNAPTATTEAGAHGTCSAGVIGARTYNSLGVAGIAGGWDTQEGCKIMPLRISASAVSAVPAHDPPDEPHAVEHIAAGILYAADHGAHVLSMSMAFWVCPEYLRVALDAAVDADCVLVAAAGNYDEEAVRNTDNGGGEGEGEGEWDSTLIYPGCLKEVISVGALNTCLAIRGERKYGSNTGGGGEGEGEGEGEAPCNQTGGWGSDWGNALDIMAPGMDICTTDIVGCCGKTPGEGEGEGEGEGGCDQMDPEDCGCAGDECDYNVTVNHRYNKTSSATPQVAGVAALVLSATLDASGNRTLSRLQVQAIIEFSAEEMVYGRIYYKDGHQHYEYAGGGRDKYTGYGCVNAEVAVSLALAPRFVIRNSAGKHLASLDAQGNFVVEGSLKERATFGEMDPTNDKEFIVRQADFELLRLNSSGDMYIFGNLFEKVAADLDSAVTVQSLRFRDGTGHTVALVNSEWLSNSGINPKYPYEVPEGSIVLKGRALVGAQPDRAASQGH